MYGNALKNGGEIEIEIEREMAGKLIAGPPQLKVEGRASPMVNGRQSASRDSFFWVAVQPVDAEPRLQFVGRGSGKGRSIWGFRLVRVG